MPQTKSQRAIFALLTVFITVHAYVFFSLYVIHGASFMQWASQIPGMEGNTSVLKSIQALGGVTVCGMQMPIWTLVIIEFVLAYTLEMTIGSPLSFKLACKNFDPHSTHPVLFETAIVSATVGIMCPAMSFIAAWLYYPYMNGFHLATLLADWLKLMCFNFPFAWFTQLFFIQPIVRKLFRALCHKQIAEQKHV